MSQAQNAGAEQSFGRVRIEFDSRKFDLSLEPENPINPIPGHSFLAWLKPELERRGFEIDGIDTEDWGWYIQVGAPSGRYIVGASATPDKSDRPLMWWVSLTRSRSFREWITGQGRLTPADPFLATVVEIVKGEPEFTELEIETDPR